ncbi:hypothetical protein MUY14_10960 [Amycolatopsis sp. FBCC-B4732]|uniref:hypothetical protein n=1 Tax=Amycolatopsis sp. FBCC-B4732 TaxID=3079339 RepID=UPI001FF14FF3|nr:hypothetical protein [Amycolatopsis sp. FBCC-B4732]UOX91105.1 hypothetical protein MUY14_10960 [Amycolatopsis sp. FBCC-B4732]
MTGRVRVVVDPAAAARVSARVREFPRLREAVENISKAAGIPEKLVGEHLDRSVLRALENLGERYVTEMGAAVERVGQLRQEVDGYYRKAFRAKLRTEELAGLRAALERLRKASKELVPPDVWAQQQLRTATEAPAAAPEAVPQAPPEPVADPFADLDAQAPARAPAPRPADGPRWAARRVNQRIDALPEPLRLAVRRARHLRRSTVDAALEGRPGAAIRVLEELNGLLGHQELAQVTEAIGMTRTPDTAYALGGGLRGSRPPDARVQATYHVLPTGERAVLDRVAAVDPEFVRAMALGEERPGQAQGVPVPWRTAEMDRFAAENGLGADERAGLERALIALNRAREAERRAVEAGVGGSPDARSRAAQLDRQVTALGLPPAGQVAEALRSSALLRDLGTRNPDHLQELSGAWLEKAVRDAAEGKPLVPLEVYVRDVIMSKHVRGMVGEFAAVFQLGKDVLVLKAPDIGVTVGGTDFIVLVKGSREIWLCDNKTLSQAGLGEVSSLVENIGKNVQKDVVELTKRVRDLPDPLTGEASGVADAVARLTKARDRLKGLSAAELATPEGQAKAAAILDDPDIRVRRVITNAGGELSYLQQRLQDLKIDFADLRTRFTEIQQRLRKPGTEPRGGETR